MVVITGSVFFKIQGLMGGNAIILMHARYHMISRALSQFPGYSQSLKGWTTVQLHAHTLLSWQLIAREGLKPPENCLGDSQNKFGSKKNTKNSHQRWHQQFYLPKLIYSLIQHLDSVWPTPKMEWPSFWMKLAVGLNVQSVCWTKSGISLSQPWQRSRETGAQTQPLEWRRCAQTLALITVGE